MSLQNQSDSKFKHVDRKEQLPLKLTGLRQAIYILQCLLKLQTEQEIISKFEGDSQLVKMWTSFLVHNRWTEKQRVDDGEYRWILTDKGKDWVARFRILPPKAIEY